MSPGRAASLLLRLSDMPRGTRDGGVRSEKRVMDILRLHGCLDEATAEFHTKNAEVRASIEIYESPAAAEACLDWFCAELTKSHAEDKGFEGPGRLFVTMIMSAGRRVASYAFCWRTGGVIGKLTTVGLADRLDKKLCHDLAAIQAVQIEAEKRFLGFIPTGATNAELEDIVSHVKSAASKRPEDRDHGSRRFRSPDETAP